MIVGDDFTWFPGNRGIIIGYRVLASEYIRLPYKIIAGPAHINIE